MMLKLLTLSLLASSGHAKASPWEGNATVTKELFRIADWTMVCAVAAGCCSGCSP